MFYIYKYLKLEKKGKTLLNFPFISLIIYSGNAAPVGKIVKSNVINSAVFVGCNSI